MQGSCTAISYVIALTMVTLCKIKIVEHLRSYERVLLFRHKKRAPRWSKECTHSYTGSEGDSLRELNELSDSQHILHFIELF